MLRTYIKKVVKTIQVGKHEEAVQAYKEAVPVIDRMANKGLIHKNKAARHKSRLNAHIKAMPSTSV
jgi:small subunit ribosomal protein S20